MNREQIIPQITTLPIELCLPYIFYPGEIIAKLLTILKIKNLCALLLYFIEAEIEAVLQSSTAKQYYSLIGFNSRRVIRTLTANTKNLWPTHWSIQDYQCLVLRSPMLILYKEAMYYRLLLRVLHIEAEKHRRAYIFCNSAYIS